MYYVKICILLLAIMPTVLADTNYCDADLCVKGKKHIACGNNGNYSRICILPQLISIRKNQRRLILRKHNLLRNKIAKGFKNFPPAKRMATMVWDDELAKLAELNVKQCKMRRDQCRNTLKFSNAGQNLAITSWKGMNLTESKVIESQIQAWFNEYKVCPLHVIRSYIPSFGPMYDNFTVMVHDNSTRIGCAVIRNFSEGFTQQIMTCIYAYDNIFGEPVYSSGQTACTTGTDERYFFLCSVREEYN